MVAFLELYYDLADDVLVSQVLEESMLPPMHDVSMDDMHVFLRAVGAQTDELVDTAEVCKQVYSSNAGQP